MTAMDDVEKLKNKIIRLASLPKKIDVLIAKTRGVRMRSKTLTRFHLEELREAFEKLKLPKRGKSIIAEFIEYVRSKGDQLSRQKPVYTNVKFKVKDLRKVNDALTRMEGVKSFRSFVIQKLCEEFDIEPKGCFFTRSSKGISSPQILIPNELIDEIMNKLSRKRARREKKEVVAMIRSKIERILAELEGGKQ